MPSLTVKTQALGPVIQFAVWVSDARRRTLLKLSRPVPIPIVTSGLLDTGASGTCIDPSILRQLGIQPTGVANILTPSTGGTPCQCNQYDVSLGFYLDNGDLHFIDTLPVIESTLAPFGHHALIGRDVMEKAILIFNGRAETVTLSF